MRTILAVALLWSAMATAADPPPPAPAPPAPKPAPTPAAAPIFPSVQIDIEPGSDTGQFTLSARVFDLSSRRVLATPQLLLQQGTPGSVEVEGPGGAFKVRIEGGIDPTGTSAQWSYSISEQGIVIADSRGTVTLTRPRDAGY